MIGFYLLTVIFFQDNTLHEAARANHLSATGYAQLNPTILLAADYMFYLETKEIP